MIMKLVMMLLDKITKMISCLLQLLLQEQKLEKRFYCRVITKKISVVINQYPENQSVFTKKSIVPVEQSYSKTVKN